MYKIMSGGEVIALCESPTYIRLKHSTGCYVKASRGNAEGIAVAGTPYNLPGHVMKPELAEAYPVEVDAGEQILFQVGDFEGRTGDVLCELDASIEEIKDALCEIDDILEGGN